MKKIEFGKLAVDNYKQGEVIAWLADSTTSMVKDLQTAITSNNMGLVGLIGAQLIMVAGVANALNEDVNGKKEPTVL